MIRPRINRNIQVVRQALKSYRLYLMFLVQVYFCLLTWPNCQLTLVSTAKSQLSCGSTDPKLCELIDLTNGGRHSRHTTLWTRPNSNSRFDLWPALSHFHKQKSATNPSNHSVAPSLIKKSLKKNKNHSNYILSFFYDFLLVLFDLGANTILDEWKTSLCCVLNYFSLFPSIALFILANFPKAW